MNFSGDWTSWKNKKLTSRDIDIGKKAWTAKPAPPMCVHGSGRLSHFENASGHKLIATLNNDLRAS